VPISGFQGDNMIEKSDNMSWYKVRIKRMLKAATKAMKAMDLRAPNPPS
jgi:translation elongation factor EF-1alpha